MKTSYEHITELIEKLDDLDRSKGESLYRRNIQELYHLAQLVDPYMTPSKGEYVTQGNFEERVRQIKKSYWKFNIRQGDEILSFIKFHSEWPFSEQMWWAYLFAAKSLYKPKDSES